MDQRNGITGVAFQEEKFNAKNKYFTIKQNLNAKKAKGNLLHLEKFKLTGLHFISRFLFLFIDDRFIKLKFSTKMIPDF